MTREAAGVTDDQDHLKGPVEAEQPLRNYEPTDVTPPGETAAGFMFRYPMIGKDGTRPRDIYITVPNEPGASWENSKARAFRFYDALRSAEDWVEQEGIVENLAAEDEANDWRHARAINNYAAGIIQNNYLRVYIQRAVSDPEETEFLEQLASALEVKDTSDLLDRLFQLSEATAKHLAGEWAALEDGPGSLPQTAREYYEAHAANLAAAAIMRGWEEREKNPDLDWPETFDRHLQEVTEERYTSLALAHGESIARATLEAHKPVELPITTLRQRLGLNQLLEIAGTLLAEHEQATALEYPKGEALGLRPEPADLNMLSMQPAQTIDRAARGPAGWSLDPDLLPRFTDPRSPLFVEYQLDGATAEALAEGVNRLNPRTADVWRLIAARTLEAWTEGQDVPPGIWLDVREIAAAMGYKKHHKGGYKPEHLTEVAKAVQDLNAFHITLPLGTQIYQPAAAGSKKRPPVRLEASRTYKVLTISARDEVRNMFGERYGLRYKLRLDEWIRHYPRQFAPLFKTLVELPAKAGVSTWAKAIGTEIVFQYKQNSARSTGVERLKVKTLLERSLLLEEAATSRYKGRMRDYFEGALSLLSESEPPVCGGWEYDPEDSDRLEAVAGTRGWFDVWLECRVCVTVPQNVKEALQKSKEAAQAAIEESKRAQRSKTRA